MLRLEEIEFGGDQFRKLKDIKISIAQRITVIAGHNGVGKSTILGLIANCSGEQNETSLFGRVFRSNFQELFYLNYYHDYEKYQKDNKKSTPKVYLRYNFENTFRIEKSCSVSTQKRKVHEKKLKSHMVTVESTIKTHVYHSRNKVERGSLDEEVDLEPSKQNLNQYIEIWRLRIIPRTSKLEKISSEIPDLLEKQIKKINGSGSAKIPLPTIYLGMSRMTPIGEFSDEDIDRKTVLLQKEEIDLIISVYKGIFPNCSCQDKIITHLFTGSKKGSCLPLFDDCDSFSISLGQDSLSSIITALASFNQLKRKQKDKYRGGILIIDEVDAGFHPRAQEKLIQQLDEYSKKLNLQIIITTHSLTIIENVLKMNNHPGINKMHQIAYLMDTKQPRLMIDPNLEKIKVDMLALDFLSSGLKPIKIYFEDDEALFFFDHILQYNCMSANNFFGNQLKLISLNIGCDTLLKLFEKDDYFQNVILIPDNDVMSKDRYKKIIENNASICPLPKDKSFNSNTPPTLKTPEMILYNYLQDKVINYNYDDKFWKDLPENCTTDYLQDKILSITEANNDKKRDINKNWFNNNKNFIIKCNIVEKWCEENREQIDCFIGKLKNAIENIKNN